VAADVTADPPLAAADAIAPESALVDPASAEPDPAAAAPDPAVEKLQAERDRYYDLLLRKTAEFDNYRKRVERERREQADTATANILLELLSVVDDFERALKAETVVDQSDGYRRGVEIIHRQLLDLLRRRGVKPIDAIGADFDPHLHQAVSHEESPEHRRGEIVEEYRRGYMLGDRLLRPAMVKVANA
jgi:molecular chaperone GrpE